jgi:peptide/nickel transport system substrate-binding protein
MRVARCLSVLLLAFVAACAGEPVGDLGEGGDGAVDVGDAPEEGDQAGTGQEAGEAESGGDLVFALAEEPDSLDPSLARTLVGRMVFINMCEALYDVDEDLQIVAQLAGDLPEFSDDGLTVTIPVREGVNFTDGTPLDAEAVKISLDRHREISGSARASELAPVDEVTVVDPMTVEIQLSEPFAPLTATLADRAGMMMSPTQLEELGDDFSQEPVCVGPFQFVERRSQDRIVLERAEEYYDADEVMLDRVTFIPIVDGSVRTSNLRSGDVHMAERMDTTDLDTVEDDPNLQLVEATSIGYQGVTINVGNTEGIGQPFGERDAPLADPLVREAFELSMDREVINRIVFNGRFEEGCSPISPVSPFAEALDCPPRDVERAQQLLEEAGVATPVPVELMVSTGAENIRLGEVIQSLAGEAGFEVSVQATEFATSLDLADQGNFDTYQVGWSGRIDPDGNLHAFHHSEGTLNYSGASDPEIDAMLDEGRTATDEDERRSLYADVVDRVVERRNIIYLYHQNLFVGADDSIVGFQFYPDGLPRLKTTGFGA